MEVEVEVAVEGGGEHKDIRSWSYGLYCLAAGFTGRGKRKGTQTDDVKA